MAALRTDVLTGWRRQRRAEQAALGPTGRTLASGRELRLRDLGNGNIVVTNASATAPDATGHLNSIETYQFAAQTLTLLAGSNGNNNGIGALNGGNNRPDPRLQRHGHFERQWRHGRAGWRGRQRHHERRRPATTPSSSARASATDTISGFDADAGGGGQDLLALRPRWASPRATSPPTSVIDLGCRQHRHHHRRRQHHHAARRQWQRQPTSSPSMTSSSA